MKTASRNSLHLKSNFVWVGLVSLALGLYGPASAPAQPGFQVQLHAFTNSSADGRNPTSGLASGPDNAIYGTTSTGGASGAGIIFKINRDGSEYQVIHHFADNPDGALPSDSFCVATNGLLYGTTKSGGSNGLGTIYRLGFDGGGYQILHHFTNAPDGASPGAKLTQGLDGALYGTTTTGGTNGDGTLFKLNPDGNGYTVLRSFTSAADGKGAQELIQIADGFLYGCAQTGGSSNFGTVFKVAPDGNGFQVLHHFTNSPDGALPAGRLTQGTDGALYGVTGTQGSTTLGTIFKLNPDGNGYKVIHTFTGNPDGSAPRSGLTLGWDNAFYGVTASGGTNNGGTIYKIFPGTGVYSVVYHFSFSAASGRSPFGALLQGPSSPGDSGVFYGTALFGGQDGIGTVYAFVVNPPLTITPLSNQKVITWPAWAVHYILQTTTDPQAGNWTTVTNGIPVTGVQLTNTVDPKTYFRLISPQ